MLLKTIAHSFASSKLKKEEAYTQSLVRKYEQESQQIQQRIHDQRMQYKRDIESYQEKRNRELKEYMDFISSQIGLASEYVVQLRQFQSLFFPCLNAWFQLDLCKKEINFIFKQIKTISSTMELIDMYIKEIQTLQQRKRRKEWLRFTSQRVLFESNFITEIQQSITNLSRMENLEFSNEIKRLRSHKDALLKQKRELFEKKDSLNVNSEKIKKSHLDNKKLLIQQYGLCLDYWNKIKDKFESFYAYKTSNNTYLNQWIADCQNGGTLAEIKALIRDKNDMVESARKTAQETKEKFHFYKNQVKQAHNTGNFDTFDKDKAKRDEYYHKQNDAVTYSKSLVEARKTLYCRRNEISDYIDKVKMLHPDSVINDISLLLQNDKVLNTHGIFGISSRKQKNEYRKHKELGVKDAK